MLFEDKYKSPGGTSTHAGSPDATKRDPELSPMTLAILALLTSPFFLVGIPVAHVALARARQHPTPSAAARTLATTALVLSYLSIPVVVLLVVAERHR